MDLVFITYLGLTGDWWLCHFWNRKGFTLSFLRGLQVKDTNQGTKNKTTKKTHDLLAEFLGFGWTVYSATYVTTQKMLFQPAEN